jgi:23S rRNA (cytidine1920-2'-O)/16S rRNA (cytidine1409-2'-O)-methyltransferase
VALDVGTNQLDWSLRSDPRVISMEKTDIRDYKPKLFFDLIVCDLSFVSLRKIIGPVLEAIPQFETVFLFLVKPQFELQKSRVPSGGIVTNPEDRKASVKTIIEALEERGLVVSAPFDCPLLGRHGNQETFLFAKRSP